MKHNNNESNKSERMEDFVKNYPKIATEWSVEKNTSQIPINYCTSSFKCVWIHSCDHAQEDYETS